MSFKGLNNLDELLKFAKSPKLFCDLDGVLANFDKGFQDLGYPPPQEFMDKYGKDAFWKILPQHPRFFRDLEWMPDGKELWSYIKQFNPTILSAPARESTMPHCKEDKIAWVKEHLGNIEIIIDANKGKYTNDGDILIDDREKNIIQWEAANGVGILHTSAADTIKKLQQLL
jgi:5'(3')-deoxyribonucleotidase